MSLPFFLRCRLRKPTLLIDSVFHLASPTGFLLSSKSLDIPLMDFPINSNEMNLSLVDRTSTGRCSLPICYRPMRWFLWQALLQQPVCVDPCTYNVANNYCSANRYYFGAGDLFKQQCPRTISLPAHLLRRGRKKKGFLLFFSGTRCFV
jgi:hypothetical protein